MSIKTIGFQIIAFFSSFTLLSQNTTLVINELSQGNATQEYVEFLVVSSNTDGCVRPTLDLRKWVFDDNSGYFKAGSGAGIASGCMRFADNAFWSSVPAGTLILIYNSDDYDASVIPTIDTDLNDGNCRLIIPSSSNLLEKNSLPSITNSTIPTSGWTAGGDWATVAMRNGGDAFQIYNSSNLTTPTHAVSYGDNTLHQDIYFSGAATGLVYSFKNTVSDDYHDINNWSASAITGNQTPGLSNSPQNDAYVLAQSHNCSTAQNNSSVDLQTTVLQPTSCGKNNAILNSTVSGGTAPYTYIWSNGGQTSTLNQIGSGNYTLIVEDANGCKDTATIVVPPSTPGPTLSLTATPATCGQSNGAVSSEVTGGSQPYSYLWGNGSTSSSINNLPEGNYTLTVTDNQGCDTTKSVTVTNSSSLEITNITTKNASCGANDGSIQISVSGGTSPYNYVWSNGGTSNTNNLLSAGNYQVTVTDQTGCSISNSVTVLSDSSLTVSLTATQTAIEDGDSTHLSVSTVGGTAPYTYQWQTSETLNCSNCEQVTATPSTTTTYTVLVTSDEGCKGNASILISIEKQCGQVFFPNIFSPNNDGINDYFFVQGKCIDNGQLFIYNRWGEVVFKTDNLEEKWDGTFRGKEVSTGVYFYKAEISDTNEKSKTYAGSITLSR